MEKNLLFQWLNQNISIIAIIISVISLSLSIIALICFIKINGKNKEKDTEKKCRILNKICYIRYRLFHIIVFVCLTGYVVINWKECISMQFFSSFNGNNILFLVWILLIFLNIYRIKFNNVEVVSAITLAQEYTAQSVKYENEQQEYMAQSMKYENEQQEHIDQSANYKKEQQEHLAKEEIKNNHTSVNDAFRKEHSNNDGSAD